VLATGLCYVGQSLSTCMVALYADFDQYLDTSVAMPSVTLLQDRIIN